MNNQLLVIARVSVIAANRRSRHETMFIIQSLIVFIFMAYDAVYTSLRKIYEPVSIIIIFHVLKMINFSSSTNFQITFKSFSVGLTFFLRITSTS